jgi:hypothetical protein
MGDAFGAPLTPTLGHTRFVVRFGNASDLLPLFKSLFHFGLVSGASFSALLLLSFWCAVSFILSSFPAQLSSCRAVRCQKASWLLTDG